MPDEARTALERGEDIPLTGGPGESTYLDAVERLPVMANVLAERE